MAFYVAVTRLNGDETAGKLHSLKGGAIEDAIALLREKTDIKIAIQRWDVPRAENRGQLESYTSSGGRKYDRVEIEVMTRRRARETQRATF